MNNPFTQDDAKKIAIGAGVGAVIAGILPFVGWPLGALVGGGIVAAQKFRRR